MKRQLQRTWVKRRRTGQRTGQARRSARILCPAYRAWIRAKPCYICYLQVYGYFGAGEIGAVFGRQATRTEVAHIGERGLGQKCSDRQTMPLCNEHHQSGKDAHHGPIGRGFWAHHGLDRDAVIRQLNEAYERGGE